jgi:hypothetical protein
MGTHIERPSLRLLSKGLADGRTWVSVRSQTARVMKALMRSGRDRRSGKPVETHAKKAREFVWGRSADHIRASGQRPHSKAEYMTAPERFADSQIPLAPRAPSIHEFPTGTAGPVGPVHDRWCLGPAVLTDSRPSFAALRRPATDRCSPIPEGRERPQPRCARPTEYRRPASRPGRSRNRSHCGAT